MVELARRGADVTFVYHSNSEAAESLVAELNEEGLKVQAAQADVRDGERAQAVVDAIVEKHDRIDILVNSAGIVADGLLGSMLPDQWSKVIDTNLTGAFNYCRAVTQQMMYQRSGSVVNLSSTAAEFASRGQVNYAASKGGINGMTKGMAKELAPRKVRVNAVSPGDDRNGYECRGPQPGRRSNQEGDPHEADRQAGGDRPRGGVPGQR